LGDQPGSWSALEDTTVLWEHYSCVRLGVCGCTRACVSACARGGMTFREGTAGGTLGVPGVWFSVFAVGVESFSSWAADHRRPRGVHGKWAMCGEVWSARSCTGTTFVLPGLGGPGGTKVTICQSHEGAVPACHTQPVALPSPSWDMAFASASWPSH